jgi:ABC-2 type transport system permease protein
VSTKDLIAGPEAELATGPTRVVAPVPDRSLLVPRVVSSRLRIFPRIRDIWLSRELLVFLIRKELKVKYKNSVLGFFWSMLNPAIVLLVYFVVFRYFMKNNVPQFALYLFSGLIAWNLFGSALNGASASIVANAGIVKKVSFPREILALAQVGTSTVYFFLQSAVLVLFLLAFQRSPAWSYMPVLAFALIDLLVITAAFALFLAAVNVYFRDVQHLIEVLLQAWFWGVPIIYSYNIVTSLFAKHPNLAFLPKLYLLDPITPIVLAFQRTLYARVYIPAPYANHPHAMAAQLATYPYHTYVWMLSVELGAGILLLFGAMAVFGRIEGNFAEEL